MQMTNKQKQCLLTFLGYDTGGVDGIWGDKSRNATERFQRDFGLDPDGVAGEQTEQAMRHAVCYGMPVREDVTDINVGNKTGTFWDDIEFFTRDEFKCKCGGEYCNGFPHEPQEGMVRLADGARRHFGKPAIVISGLRDPIHNRNEGGVDSSQHIYGEACDIQIPGVSADTLLNWFQSQPGVRYAYAINATNVHFDIPKGDR
jgi:peptidoglycan hydrolase-like protein with peptidoglycan-binding domain